MKIFSLLIVLGLVGLIAFVSEKNLNYNSGIIQFRGVASPVTNIVFTSNGVLNSEWFKNWFGPMRKRTLMELDITELHDDLLKEPQIFQILGILFLNLINLVYEGHARPIEGIWNSRLILFNELMVAYTCLCLIVNTDWLPTSKI